MKRETTGALETAPTPEAAGVNEETKGLVYAILSAICYTVSLAALRGLTNYPEVSPDWSIAIKELTTVGCVLPFILVQYARGKYRFPAKSVFLALVAAGVLCQAVGARNHMLAYAVVGLALATPLVQAFQLILSSLIGAFWLHERVTKSRLVALVLLVCAVWILSGGSSGGAGETAEIAGKPLRLGLGVALTAATALGYASQLSIMRKVLRVEKTPDALEKNLYAPTTLAMVVVTGIGAIICGFFLSKQHGAAAWLAPPVACWRFALVAGVANMIGFYFQIEGLRRLFVLKHTMIANIQTITLALFGVVFYHEAFTWSVALGVALVAVGVTLASGRN